MTIPIEIVWTIVIAIVGFILGTLWGHHGSILKRVTYEECSKKCKDCPCVNDINKLKNKMGRKRK